MIIRKSASVIARSLWAGHISARAAIRMAAYAVLAELAASESTAGGHSFLYKAHVGAMRGTFRREVAKRRAVRMAAEYRDNPAILAFWRSHEQNAC